MKRSNSAPIEFHRSETDPIIDNVENFTNDPDPSKSGRVRQKTASTQISEDESIVDDPHHKGIKGNGNGWGRGIVADAKRTIGTHWMEEMTNFNQKTVAVSFFLFFACIAPAITFGAIYAKATHNWIGAVEMITATAWCGIVYSLIGGQPMMINGGTGPVLAFTEILYKMSESLDVPFLTFNAWIGIWVSIYLFIAAFVDLNRIIIYATRFTDEIFSFLIATIFIINAIGSPFASVGVYYYFEPDHKSHDEHEDDEDYSYMASAFLSLILCLGTVQLSFLLRKMKFSPFLPSQTARNAVTDFAVVTSILIMTLVANVLFSNTPTETLNVPDQFAPTYACCTESCETNWPDDCPDQDDPYGQRSWLVNLGDVNGKSWVPFMAAGPALLAFILVFLDDGITWHLINHPTHKLQHGEAYNYDTLIIGLMIAINSLLGLPWLVAATVRSLNHIHAMAEKSPDGKIQSIQETRLTHLGIHLLCLASVFALGALKLIPVPVLYGVFLFMGLVSLGTNQFWGRIMMFFMQPEKFPLEPYTQFMKPRRMHLFTAIQLGLFALLYVVKSIKTIAIAFPIIIAACIPIRLFVLPKIFTEEELVLIDSDDNTIKAWLSSHKKMTSSEKKNVEPAADDVADDHEQHDDGDVEMQSEAARKEGRRPRKKRVKSVSCPSHMLFAEVRVTASHSPGATISTTSEAEVSTSEYDGEGEGGGSDEAEGSEAEDTVPPLNANVRQRRRRRRIKSVSCPPHMLFAEAERHMNSNYFFG